MARRQRLHRPSALYHVMLRGNDGQPIFFSDEDRYRLCLLMQEGVQRFGHSIYSFCFMTNHIHLAISVSDISISQIMQNLAFRYTRYINKKYNRIGHLFQGRFKSVIVDGTRYLKELIRYIHLNPVRANLVDDPLKYVWSSHRSYLHLDEYTWLNKVNVLEKFGNTLQEAIICYDNYILNGIGMETSIEFKKGYSDGILGDKEFVEVYREDVEEAKKGDIKLSKLVSTICKRYEVSEASLCLPGKNRLESHIRSILAFFAREIESISIEELAVFLKRESSGLSKLASRLEKKSLNSQVLMSELSDLRNLIHNNDPQMSECQA